MSGRAAVEWGMAYGAPGVAPTIERTRERLGALLREGRRARTRVTVPGEARRPAIFSLLFWIVLVPAVATGFWNPADEWLRTGWPASIAATAVLIGAWQALPWDPRAGGRRKLLAPLFLVAGLVFGGVTVFLWGLALYPIAVANAVFLFGFRRGVAFATATLPLTWVSVYLFDTEAIGFWGATFMTALVVPMAVFMVGICKVVIDAERSRGEAEALLGDLAVANAELCRQTDRVKALAIAEERARLAREVHDALGHHLTAINLLLQNAERFAAGDPARSWQKVREARGSTLSALAEVRRSVRALKPPALEAERSGVAALAALARSFDGPGLAVSFELVGEERRLPEAAELALYRATQEGLTNAAKHAAATRVRVRLVVGAETVGLTVADDGRGAAGGALEGGFGLAGLRERVAALGGTLAAGNRPEGGFGVEVRLPVDAASGAEAEAG